MFKQVNEYITRSRDIIFIILLILAFYIVCCEYIDYLAKERGESIVLEITPDIDMEFYSKD